MRKSAAPTGMCRDCLPKNPKRLAAVITHHGTGGPLWYRYCSMIHRCHGAGEDPRYKRYRDRGVYVCAEWRYDFTAFKAWALANGYSPELQIDRIDPDGPYSPTNCRFLSRLENSRRSVQSKLTADIVREIKRAISDGARNKDLAAKYGVANNTISQIRTGDAWADIV